MIDLSFLRGMRRGGKGRLCYWEGRKEKKIDIRDYRHWGYLDNGYRCE